MARQFLDKCCEWGIHGLVLGILIFGPLATGAVRVPDFLIIQAAAALVLVLWLARFWLNPRYRLLWPPICWAVVAFVIYAIVRCQFAEIEYIARQELIRVTVYAVLFFAVLNNLNRSESARLVSFVLIGLAGALALFAIYQFAVHYAKIWQFIKPPGYWNRGSGTYINPNHFAGFLEMILPLALAYTLLGRLSATAKVVLGYLALVILAGIGISLSRGGMIATAVALVVFFLVLLFQRDFWLHSLIGLGVLVTAGIIFFTNTTHSQLRFNRIFSEGKMEDGRFHYWNSAKQIWHKNLWAGAGPGHFDYEFWGYASPDVQGRAQYAHNDYLNTLADWGVTGLAIILIVLLVFYAGVFRTWPFVRRSTEDFGSRFSNKAAFVIGGALGVLAMAAHSFLDFNMQIPANAILAITLLALISSQRRFATERFWTNPGTLGRIAITAIGALALGFLMQQEIRRVQEYRWLQRANAEKISPETRLAALQKAAAIEPMNFETAYTLGEFFRLESWQGRAGYEKKANEAIGYFKRASQLNPYDPFTPLRLGMCLDWLGKSQQATPYFERAQKLNPNGYFVAAYEGWHFIQLENYPEAKKQLERSLSFRYTELAAGYLDLVNERMTQPANPLERK